MLIVSVSFYHSSISLWSVLKKKPAAVVKSAHSPKYDHISSDVSQKMETVISHEENWISSVAALQSSDLVASGKCLKAVRKLIRRFIYRTFMRFLNKQHVIISFAQSSAENNNQLFFKEKEKKMALSGTEAKIKIKAPIVIVEYFLFLDQQVLKIPRFVCGSVLKDSDLSFPLLALKL